MRHPCLQMRTFQDVNINHLFLLFVRWCNIRLCLFPASSNQSDHLIPQIGHLSYEQVPYGSKGRHFEYQDHYDLNCVSTCMTPLPLFWIWMAENKANKVSFENHACTGLLPNIHGTHIVLIFVFQKNHFFLLGWVVLVSWPNIINCPCCLRKATVRLTQTLPRFQLGTPRLLRCRESSPKRIDTWMNGKKCEVTTTPCITDSFIW